MEGPDVDYEIRSALVSGPAYTAVKERGVEDVTRALRATLEPFVRDDVGVWVPQAVEYLVASKPS